MGDQDKKQQDPNVVQLSLANHMVNGVVQDVLCKWILFVLLGHARRPVHSILHTVQRLLISSSSLSLSLLKPDSWSFAFESGLVWRARLLLPRLAERAVMGKQAGHASSPGMMIV